MTKTSTKLIALMAITMNQTEGNPPVDVAKGEPFDPPEGKRQWLIDSGAAATASDAAKVLDGEPAAD